MCTRCAPTRPLTGAVHVEVQVHWGQIVPCLLERVHMHHACMSAHINNAPKNRRWIEGSLVCKYLAGIALVKLKLFYRVPARESRSISGESLTFRNIFLFIRPCTAMESKASRQHESKAGHHHAHPHKPHHKKKHHHAHPSPRKKRNQEEASKQTPHHHVKHVDAGMSEEMKAKRAQMKQAREAAKLAEKEEMRKRNEEMRKRIAAKRHKKHVM